jgi:hypothetical protein
VESLPRSLPQPRTHHRTYDDARTARLVAIALALEGVLAMSTFVIAARTSESYTSDLQALLLLNLYTDMITPIAITVLAVAMAATAIWSGIALWRHSAAPHERLRRSTQFSLRAAQALNVLMAAVFLFEMLDPTIDPSLVILDAAAATLMLLMAVFVFRILRRARPAPPEHLT